MENRMIGIGAQFPKFRKTSVVSIEMGNEFYDITSEDHINNKKWMVKR